MVLMPTGPGCSYGSISPTRSRSAPSARSHSASRSAGSRRNASRCPTPSSRCAPPAAPCSPSCAPFSTGPPARTPQCTTRQATCACSASTQRRRARWRAGRYRLTEEPASSCTPRLVREGARVSPVGARGLPLSGCSAVTAASSQSAKSAGVTNPFCSASFARRARFSL